MVYPVFHFLKNDFRKALFLKKHSVTEWRFVAKLVYQTWRAQVGLQGN